MQQRSLRTVKLQAVVPCSFQRSEYTNYMQWRRKNTALARSLREGDVVLLVSAQWDQLIFIYGFIGVHEREDGPIRPMIRSERYRLPSGGTFNPYMLQDYAAKVGLHIEGRRRFEDHFYARERFRLTGEYVNPELAERALRAG